MTKPTKMFREHGRSRSASVLVTMSGPGPDAGCTPQREQADRTITHWKMFSHPAQIQTRETYLFNLREGL